MIFDLRRLTVPWVAKKRKKIKTDMKKLIGIAIVAACLGLVLSCQKEGWGTRKSVQAVFSVQVPVESVTRAVSQGEKADVVFYEVWDEDFSERLYPHSGKEDNSAEVRGGVAEIVMDLVKDQTFNLIFWAQNEDCGAYSWQNLKNVDVDYAKFTSDQKDVYDAFYAVVAGFRPDGSSKTVYLYRPFAQINFCASKMTTTMGELSLQGNIVKVSQVARTFSTISGTGINPINDVTFTTEAGYVEDRIIEVDGNDFTWVSMNYLLVPTLSYDKPSATVNLTADFETELGTVRQSVVNVPIQTNHRTNIVGDLFTAGTTLKIVVDPDFNKPDKPTIEVNNNNI